MWPIGWGEVRQSRIRLSDCHLQRYGHVWMDSMGETQDRHRTDTGQTRDRHGTDAGQTRDRHGTDTGQTPDRHGTDTRQHGTEGTDT